MQELKLRQGEAHIPTVKELQAQLGCTWQTAKYISRELSTVCRAMQKGAKLLVEESRVLLSSTRKCISKQVVELIDSLFGLEYSDVIETIQERRVW